jgi:hypothetical protein
MSKKTSEYRLNSSVRKLRRLGPAVWTPRWQSHLTVSTTGTSFWPVVFSNVGEYLTDGDHHGRQGCLQGGSPEIFIYV